MLSIFFIRLDSLMQMTEADAAFTSLMSLPSMYKERSESIDVFYSRFCHESLAVDS